jgi:hypothetical protein
MLLSPDETVWPFRRSLLAMGFALAFAGCSGSAIKTHPVQGKIEFADGNVEPLVGSIIEFMQVADPLIRSSGAIKSGGTYSMETMYQGEIVPGVPEGSYKARIILSDDEEPGATKKTGIPVDKRFLDFATSGLSVTVPGGDFTLKLTR